MTREFTHWDAKLAARCGGQLGQVLSQLGAQEAAAAESSLSQTLFGGTVPPDLSALLATATRWSTLSPLADDMPLDGEAALLHPLSGARVPLFEHGGNANELAALAETHLKKVASGQPGGEYAARSAALALWRFAPDTSGSVADAWRLLPSDARMPVSSLWDQLDLTAAFAGAMFDDADDNPALLSISFGPVQGFIEQSRSTSDLWAGSHLLSRIAWEGMRVVCERLGPEAVLFPRLRGIPQVDLWLRDEMGVKGHWESLPWAKEKSDANPLFSAALPNRFLALVPASEAAVIADEVREAVRGWVRDTATQMLRHVLTKADVPDSPEHNCWQQLEEQLAEFPEVHWAAVPWKPLVGESDKGLDVAALRKAVTPFFGNSPHPYLDGETFRQLNTVGGAQSAPGLAYAALHDLVERVAAAAKSERLFEQTPQHGYRCSLSGEHEWLSLQAEELLLPPGKRVSTLWARFAEESPSLLRKGEHLCAQSMLKRLWPSHYLRELESKGLKLGRFVVSTHGMALTTSLEQWLHSPKRNGPDTSLLEELEGSDRIALPARLARQLHAEDSNTQVFMRSIGGYLDRLDDVIANARGRGEKAALNKLLNAESALRTTFGKAPEIYYALVLMDGDRMGAWLSGGDGTKVLSLAESYHPQAPSGLGDLASCQPLSPLRHMAISSALNGFSGQVAQHVVERCFKGKLLYAGGDDLMAMVAVDDLLPMMLTLRLVYSGRSIDTAAGSSVGELLGDLRGLTMGGGFVSVQDRRVAVMGELATASMGAVVAHHKAPLGKVLRELRQAEKDAKQAGRDAFSIRLLKRSGSPTKLTQPWFSSTEAAVEDGPMGLLLRLSKEMSQVDLSRRVKQLIYQWRSALPPVSAFSSEADYRSLISKNLLYQFKRQGGDGHIGTVIEPLAALVANHAWQLESAVDCIGKRSDADLLDAYLSIAEFLCRERRSGEQKRETAHV